MLGDSLGESSLAFLCVISYKIGISHRKSGAVTVRYQLDGKWVDRCRTTVFGGDLDKAVPFTG